VVHVDGVGLEDVVAIHCGRVHVLAESDAGVERGVVKVADGEGYGICGRWQEAAAPSHKVLGESHLCVDTEVEASAPVPAARGPAAAPAPGAWSVGEGAVVIARNYIWGSVSRWR
jgi:hypothetical protein